MDNMLSAAVFEQILYYHFLTLSYYIAYHLLLTPC